MEIIIKFILGITIIAFVINFLALIGYITVTIRNVIFTKYKINILAGLFYSNDDLVYSAYIFTGLFMLVLILFLLVSVKMIYRLGNFIYYLF